MPVAHVAPRTLLTYPDLTRCVVGVLLGGGVEADVHSVSDREAAKLYHKRHLEDGRRTILQRKVSRLVDLGRTLAAHASLGCVVWPRTLLLDEQEKSFAGYLMPRVMGGEPLVNMFRNPAYALPERLSLALDLARAFAGLHTRNLLVGDPSCNNVLVKREAGAVSLHLVDVDSFQLDSLPHLVGGTSRYHLPAVLQKKEAFLPSLAADDHALAFLLFELLMGGQSPYAHKGGESPEENIAKEFVPYAGKTEFIPDGVWAARWRALPAVLQRYFLRAFDPASAPRPSAKDWTTLLASISVPSFWPDAAPPVQAKNGTSAAPPPRRRVFQQLRSLFRSKTA